MVIQVEYLKNVPYFAGLSPDELESVRRLLVEKKAERGEIIFMDGEPARALYLLVSGVVKIFKTSVSGKEQILTIVRPGESFNDISVFDNGITPASAEAMTPVEFYEIDKSVIDSLIYKYPQITRNVISVLAARVRSLVNLVEDLSFRTVVGRVAKILLDSAMEGKEAGSQQHPRLTQQEMAAIAGTAREVVGRSLKTLEDKGIIKLDRHRIIITDREALKNFISTFL